MSNLFWFTGLQVLDSNGDPINGAKLNFYETGTSTPKNTYSESTLTTANANPVVADANGRFGSIYLLADGAYKVVLTDASDNTISTIDPVDARVASVVATQLAGTVTATGLAASGQTLVVDIDNLTATTTIDATNDKLMVYDNSAGGLRSALVQYVQELPRGHLAGLQISNNGTDSDHDIDIAAGECRGKDDDEDIRLSAFTKRIDASWSAGTGNGGMSSSVSLGNSTWYHVFAINVGGSADVGFDTSVTGANLVSDHSATAVRRIGSVLTDASANIIAFTQTGDVFMWDGPDGIALALNSTSISATATTFTMDVPTGLKILAIANVIMSHGSGTQVLISDPDQDDEAPSLTAAPLGQFSTGTSSAIAAQIKLMTDTSAQWRVRSGASSTTVRVATIGWIDPRGRDD